MKKRSLVMLLCSLLIVTLVLPALQVPAAAKEITIDEDVYNLYTDNFPDPIGDDVYARFTSTVKDVEEYYLNFDQEAAESSFKTALDKNKISYNEDYICYMKVFLYKYDENGDEDKSVTNQKLEIYFPLPMDAQEHPEDCNFYKLTSGKLTQVVPLNLYSIDEVNYIKMDMASTDFSSIYGFVYKNPEEYEEEDDGSGSDDESDDEDDFEEDDATPTPKPTATPTPKPEDSTKPTATPTPKPSSGDSKNNGTGSKNTIPKTGDDFPLAGTIGIGSAAAVVLAAVLITLKRKK